RPRGQARAQRTGAVSPEVPGRRGPAGADRGIRTRLRQAAVAGPRGLPADDLGPAARDARRGHGHRCPRRAPPHARQTAGRGVAGRGHAMPATPDRGAGHTGDLGVLSRRRPRCLRCARDRCGARTRFPHRFQLCERHQPPAGGRPLPSPAHAGGNQRRPRLVRRHARGARDVRAPIHAPDIFVMMLFLLTWLGLVLIRPQEYPALLDMGIPILPIAMLGALGTWFISSSRRPLAQPTYLLFAVFIVVAMLTMVVNGWAGGAVTR